MCFMFLCCFGYFFKPFSFLYSLLFFKLQDYVRVLALELLNRVMDLRLKIKIE